MIFILFVITSTYEFHLTCAFDPDLLAPLPERHVPLLNEQDTSDGGLYMPAAIESGDKRASLKAFRPGYLVFTALGEGAGVELAVRSQDEDEPQPFGVAGLLPNDAGLGMTALTDTLVIKPAAGLYPTSSTKPDWSVTFRTPDQLTGIDKLLFRRMLQVFTSRTLCKVQKPEDRPFAVRLDTV